MTSCIVCGNNVKKIKIFDKLPVSSAHLSFNTVDIELKSKFEALVCDCCQHISNQSAITDFIYTSPNYVVKRAVSGTMSSLLTTVYDFLLTNAPNIKNKKILEIGSGSGELALSLGRAGAVVYTIDPAVKDYNTSFIHHNSCSFENFQSTQKYDLIIVRHVLEHTSDPKHFLGRINELLTEDGSVYIEVPNLVTTLLNYRAIDFFNDHIQHFSSKSLKHLLVCCGLGIVNRLDLVRNNHIGFFATKGVESIDLDEDKIESIDWYLEKSKDKLLKIYSLIDEANSIALYGAGAHATTFVSQLDQDCCNKVKYVLDKDPSKQGRYIPGLTVAVTEPSKGKTCQLIINTAVLYADEINHYILNNLNHQGTIINL